MLGELIGPGPAAAYCDACCFREENRFLTTVHLISHLYREIDGAILDVISPAALRVSESKENRKKKVEAICTILDIPRNSDLMVHWSKLQLSSLAHRKNLSRRHVDDAFLLECDHYDAILDTVLTAFASKFRIAITRVDELFAISNPSNDDVQSLLVSVPNHRAVFEHVFGRQISAGWIEALFRRGFFADPPEHAVVPALKYATVHASYASPTAIAIAGALSEIKHVEAARQYVLLLLALPQASATQLTPKVITWLEALGRPLTDAEQALLSTQLGDLVAHIAADASWENVRRLTGYLTGFTGGEQVANKLDDPEDE